MAQSSELFEALRDYPFIQDPEFANGLAIILGHPETPATEAEMSREDDLVLQAKCFFFSRKENLTTPIDFAAYKSWLVEPSTREPADSSSTANSSDITPAAAQSSTGSEPVYPTSFAHIVELITTGQPIPGIEQIPDTVLTGHDITSEKPRRRKPWENDTPVEVQNETAAGAP
ncbi:hypothetical protein N7488_000129 [Penicillium malachiteum]|nr:hypothetical protein N7488_000129 [Penicillium malachiteum]